MTEMVQKVARALCARHYAKRFQKASDDPHILTNVEGNWHSFVVEAHDAIKAMREATGPMWGAGNAALHVEGKELGDVWRAMIDAALDIEAGGDLK